MNIMKLYIDPGTGSMLFTILIGVIGAGIHLARLAFSKFGLFVSGGAKAKNKNQDDLPYVIFTDSKRYWSLFEPICDEFEKRKQKICYMTSSPDDPALDKKYEYVTCEFIGEGNKAFVKLNSLKADILLSTTPGLDVYQWKRSKNVSWYVHVPHAASDIVIYRMFGVDYYDALLLSGDYQIEQIRELEKKRNLPAKEMLLGGLPMLDELQKRLDNAGPLPDHKTTVLLAPSWGKSSIFGKYGGSIIDALKKTGYHIIVRPHPQSFTSEKDLMDKLMKQYPADDQLEWNRDNDNFEVLRRSDILISDFSGVIFEYALVFQKPVIYADTSFDRSPYDACWIDEELWTFTTLPKIGRQLTADGVDNIKELIDTVMNDESHREAIENARNETWAFRGEAAVKITDYLISKHEELLEAAKKKQEAEEEAAKSKKKSKKTKKSKKESASENKNDEVNSDETKTDEVKA